MKQIESSQDNEIFDVENYVYFDQKTSSPKRVEHEVNFIIDQLQIKKNDKILDLPCGYGKYTNFFSEKGYDITGIDINVPFLNKAKQDANVKGLDTKFLYGDMRNLSLDNSYNHILTLNTSWGYFSHHENVQVLKNMANILSPGGTIFLELMNPHLAALIIKGIKDCTAFDVEGNLLIDWRTYNEESNRFKIKRIYIKDGKRKESYLEIQNYTLPQMKILLENVGLQVTNIYGGQKGRLFDENSYRLVIIAKKFI